MPKLNLFTHILPFAASMIVAGTVSASQVVTSIKPLQLIASAIGEGVTEPELLLPENASPHSFTLRPSDMQRLIDAELIFWVGPDLEQSLVRPLQRTNARVVQLYMADAVHDDHGHKHDEHKRDDHGQKHDEHKHDDHGQKHDAHDHDAHIWLDPENGVRIAETMAAALSELIPDQADRIANNLQRFTEETHALDSSLKAQLAALSDKGFFVFHDAYGHFVGHYGLNQLGYFTLDPSRQPGARHLADIRNSLEAGNAVCVFSEPQFTPAVVESVVRGIEVRHGVLDPLATDIAVAPGAYQAFLQELADRFSDCLDA